MKVLKCSIIEFRKSFGTQNDCLKYLYDTKWKDAYKCLKCGHHKEKKGYSLFDKRCTQCNYNETPTANTLFHSIKISLPIAFEMIYRISVNKKGMSGLSLCREYDINQKTANNFRKKVQKSMKSSKQFPLDGKVHIDEFVYGGKEEGKQGRSSDSKKLKICLAMELKTDKKTQKDVIGRAYALPIENYSNTELKRILEEHVSKDAQITTDKWSGYTPSKEAFNITQILSKNGDNFPDIHNLIMNIKSWIRGIHHRISKKHLQKYLDEFCFRFNRRTFIENMPIFALKRMVYHIPSPVIATKGGFYG